MGYALAVQPDERRALIEILASPTYEPDDFLALMAEGEEIVWVDDNGLAHVVAYLPSALRAVWASNGDPVWFDASSLDDAVEQVKAGEELN